MEKPILFSTPMVKAILDGRKTQTRRVIKPQPHEEEYLIVGNYTPALVDKNGDQYPADYQIFGAYTEDGELTWKCPYGQVGDRLWVRETLRRKFNDPNVPADYISYVASATGVSNSNPTERYPGLGRPTWIWKKNTLNAMFCPRWASRITLEITEVRAERVQEICGEDAMAEGIILPYRVHGDGEYYEGIAESYIYHFKGLWDSLNAKRGYGWAVNPWCWIISFRRGL